MNRNFHLKPLAAAVALAIALPGAGFAADRQLGEIRVEAGGEGGRKSKLRDEIIATESFTTADIEKTHAANVNEAVDKNPGIAVQTECSICSVRNVTLNNLPGRYTTLLIDGIPIYSSVSAAYGLDSVGVNGLERIEVSRGAGTSLVAPEALAGVVNLVTKRPTKNTVSLTGSVGNFGSARVDGFLAKPFDGGALTLSFNANQHDAVDGNKDKVSEYTGFQRGLVGLGYFLDDVGGFKLKGRVDVVKEDRSGGAMGRDYNGIKRNDSGNPFDWSGGKGGSSFAGGWNAPDGSGPVNYDGGKAGFSEIIFTERFQTTHSAERNLDGGGKLKFAGAYARHEQDSFYEKARYKADQNQAYLEASVMHPVGETLLTGGLNYRYEDLSSTGQAVNGDPLAAGTPLFAPVKDFDGYEYHTRGFFVQAYRAFFDGRLELNGAARVDWHKDRGPNESSFGRLVSPRFSALWHHSDTTNSRVALGRGYRMPTSFFEQDHGILDTVAIEKRIKDPEISNNASYTWSWATDRHAVVASANYNRIKNVALLDTSQVDGLGNPITIFSSAEKPITVKGVDATWTWQLQPNLAATLAGERFWYDVNPTEQTLAFARPDKRVYLSLDYDTGPWDIYAKLVWTGSQDLRKFYNQYGQRYNFDGTPKKDKAPAYATVDLRVSYKVNKQWSAFVGADNVFDYVQSKKESPLWIDETGSPDVTHIWGPMRGRYIYAGVKFDL